MRRVFFTILGKIKERTIYDPNIFGCGEGRGGRKVSKLGREMMGKRGNKRREGKGRE